MTRYASRGPAAGLQGLQPVIMGSCFAQGRRTTGGDAVPLWQRLLITLAVMLLTSYLVGLLWHWLFNSDIPSYLGGVVGGVSAVPTWEFLQRIRPKQ
jgi:hypothetical protein